MADRAKFLANYGWSDLYNPNSGSWNQRVRKPWKEPTAVGDQYTNDELYLYGNSLYIIYHPDLYRNPRTFFISQIYTVNP